MNIISYLTFINRRRSQNNRTTIDIDEDFFNNDINFDQNCYFQYDLHLFSVTVSLVFTGSYNPVFLCYPFLSVFNNFFFYRNEFITQIDHKISQNLCNYYGSRFQEWSYFALRIQYGVYNINNSITNEYRF